MFLILVFYALNVYWLYNDDAEEKLAKNSFFTLFSIQIIVLVSSTNFTY